MHVTGTVLGIDQEQSLIENAIVSLGNGLRILEAGCGRQWPMSLPIKYTLTGIDLDAAALDIRRQRDLDAAILGDLRDVGVSEPRSFDVIYSAFVLEHIPGAESALKNFLIWLKPGGLLIIKVPDRDSVFGWVTRFTPFWLHVAYSRWIVGNKKAGEPGYGPYPTIYDPIISVRGMHEFAQVHDCELKLAAPSGPWRGKLIWIARTVAFSLGMVTGKRWRNASLTFILQKAAAS